MPPLLRIVLACLAAHLAGSALAQSRFSPESPAPPTRPDMRLGQESLAQQYLAMPPSEASPDDRSEFNRSVQRCDRREPAGFPDRVVAGPESEVEPEGPHGGLHLPAPEATQNHVPPADAGNRFPVEAFAQPASQGTAASADGARSPPPQLLPPPLVPAQPIPAEALVPPRDTQCATGLPGQVLPASYVSEPAADGPSGGAAIESIADGEPPSRPSAEALPLSGPREAMPLKPPASPETEGGRQRVGGLPSVVSIVGGLAVVLGIFFAVAWGMRRAAPGALATLPKQVVEVLGRATLAGRQQVHLVRCGNKLVLVSVTPEAVETLTEITDPLEVDRLAGLCEQANPNSSSAVFRRVLQQFAHEGKGTYAT